ncbi:class I SAM-dependent methyltransferase [Salibacterium salarium]|uniref:Class I SAM-dependent methyltransferase n=1 Tax=Salibacterium salarium TaxID=284579 RepID=A0A3R9QSS3_9BACI|nr:class I SAM-dependent methyltransferase [Salibacterium salarium]RSL32594.1 class I SAM-dependent methyltransferase [Salibacterium salarium]
MKNMEQIERLRTRQRNHYHHFYNSQSLFEKGSWLEKPSAAIQKYIPVIQKTPDSRVLDLGCGPGRHAIPVAQAIQPQGGQVTAVDHLPLAIEQLQHYGAQYGVLNSIQTTLVEVENVEIPEQTFDWVFAVSLLEHVSSEAELSKLLTRIEAGVISKRYVTFVIDTDVKEKKAGTNHLLEPLVECNMSASDMKKHLRQAFPSWRVVVEKEEEQNSIISRGQGTIEQSKNVITFLAQKY